MKFLRTLKVIIILLLGLTKLRTQKKGIIQAKKEGDFEREQLHILEAEKIYSNYVVKKLNLNIEIEGFEKLPKNGPLLFVGNHQSYFDILITLYALNKFPFGFIAKDSIGKLPFFRPWLDNVKCLFIKRENTKEALKLIKEAGKLFESGYSLFIFPEGTRGNAGDDREFKAGAFKFATKAKVPIIPVTIIGARKLFEKKGYFERHDTKIVIHDMKETKDLTRTEEKQLIKEIESTIKSIES